MKDCGECIYHAKGGGEHPCINCDETGSNWISKHIVQRNIDLQNVVGFIPSANTTKTLEGVKFDSNKPQWSLMQWKALSHVVDVLTYGAKKYAPDNWKKVPNARQRYIDAGFRHFTAYASGEKNDSETGLSHLAHAMCCMLFLLSFDLGEDK